MFVSCHGWQTQATVRDQLRQFAAAAAAMLLTGCTDNANPAASVHSMPVALALLLALAVGALAAGVAYWLGAAHSRARCEQALRTARAEARWLAQLQEGTPWQTDALHQLSHWQGGAATAAVQRLFSDAALRARLQGQRSFTEQRVDLVEPFQHSRGWLLRGVPRQDDLGAFCGFAGIALPLQALDEQQTQAAALAPLLALHPGPALLALDVGNGWALHGCNDAARRHWPQLAPGQALPAALTALTAMAALPAAAGVGALLAPDGSGWQALPCAGLPAGWRGLVMVRPPAPATATTIATTTGTTTAPPAATPTAMPAPGGDIDAGSHHATSPGAGVDTATGGLVPAPPSHDNEGENASFSFTLSHDLRAPIRVVEGFTRIVKEDYGRLLDRVGNDHLDRVLGAAARMNLMIDALLTLARLSSQPLARQPVNLSQLASYVLDDLRRIAPEREVQVEIEPGLVSQGDPTLLRLVLENLLGNAWKYTGRTAQARLSLGLVPGADGGTRRTYVVRDNGAGFDMRSSDRLFGLFQRLHSASEFPGHGVGLASVRRIVRRHGGDIWAEAEPGRGAAFYFTLSA